MPSSNAFSMLSLCRVFRSIPCFWHFPIQGDLLPFLLGKCRKKKKKEFPVHRADLCLFLGETTTLFSTVVVPFCNLTGRTWTILAHPSLTKIQCCESFSFIMFLIRTSLIPRHTEHDRSQVHNTYSYSSSLEKKKDYSVLKKQFSFIWTMTLLCTFILFDCLKNLVNISSCREKKHAFTLVPWNSGEYSLARTQTESKEGHRKVRQHTTFSFMHRGEGIIPILCFKIPWI